MPRTCRCKSQSASRSNDINRLRISRMLSLKGPKYSSAGAGPLAKHASGVNVDIHANANAKMRADIVLQLSEHRAEPYTCLLARIGISHALLIFLAARFDAS